MSAALQGRKHGLQKFLALTMQPAPKQKTQLLHILVSCGLGLLLLCLRHYNLPSLRGAKETILKEANYAGSSISR